MYNDSEDDDDPFAPRTGPAAMLSPRSKFAPYFLGRPDTFEGFLEDFEGRAYDRELTGSQRVDTFIRYVDPPTVSSAGRLMYIMHATGLSFGNYSCTPLALSHHGIVSESRSCTTTSKTLPEHEWFAKLQYYRQFRSFSAPLIHTGHLSEEDRDAAFWCGFHPVDHEALRSRLHGKHPFQPLDISFPFEDIFGYTCGAFSYEEFFSFSRTAVRASEI